MSQRISKVTTLKTTVDLGNDETVVMVVELEGQGDPADQEDAVEPRNWMEPMEEVELGN